MTLLFREITIVSSYASCLLNF